MENKKLPIGIRKFREIREGGYYYVDKTAYVDELINRGMRYVILARPPRFGKSLFIDTMKEALEGNEELFRGLALHGTWDWSKRHTVLHLDLSEREYAGRNDLEETVQAQIGEIERQYGVTTKERSCSFRLRELARRMHSETGKRVALLVDGCDKPILDTIGTPEIAAENKSGLSGIYALTKSSQEDIDYSFFIGGSRFHMSGIFSTNDNLQGITTDKEYSSAFGFTEEEIGEAFAPELDGLDREEMREWYSGYNWQGKEKLYNPYDILCLLDKREYRPWWFEARSPNPLDVVLRMGKDDPASLDSVMTGSALADAFKMEAIDLDSMDDRALLFHAGYLTLAIEEDDDDDDMYSSRYSRLDFPNRAVRQHLSLLRLETMLPKAAKTLIEEGGQLHGYLSEGDTAAVKAHFQSILASLPKKWHEDMDERGCKKHFMSICYSSFAGAGLMACAEKTDVWDRTDLAVSGPSYAYLFEFSLSDGDEDDEAKKEKRTLDMEYAQKYRGTDRPVYAVKVEFSKGKRKITGFEVVEDDGGGS